MLYLIGRREEGKDFFMLNYTGADKIVLSSCKAHPQDRQVRAYKIKKYIDTLLITNNDKLFEQGMKNLTYQLNNILYLDFEVYFNYRKYIDILDNHNFKIILLLREEEFEKYIRKERVKEYFTQEDLTDLILDYKGRDKNESKRQKD